MTFAYFLAPKPCQTPPPKASKIPLEQKKQPQQPQPQQQQPQPQQQPQQQPSAQQSVQPPVPDGSPTLHPGDGAMAGGDLAPSPSGPVGQPPVGTGQRHPAAHARPVGQDAPTSASRKAAEKATRAARPPRAGKLARIVIGSFVTHNLGPRPTGERCGLACG